MFFDVVLKTYWRRSGLFAFASTTLVLSLYNVQARHVTVPNVVVGMALFYGGLAQFLAGMWEFAAGNTFGATGEYRGNFPIIHFRIVQGWRSTLPCERITCDTFRGVARLASSKHHYRIHCCDPADYGPHPLHRNATLLTVVFFGT
jgi:hypothetical protein